jgi:hypothetical protein
MWGDLAILEDNRYLAELTKLLECGECGSNMILTTKWSKGNKYIYYSCPTYHRKGKEFCSQSGVNKDKLLKIIFEQLESDIKEAVNKDENSEEYRRLKDELEIIQDEIEKTVKGISNLLKHEDMFPEEQFKLIADELKNELEKLNVKKEEIEIKIEKHEKKINKYLECIGLLSEFLSSLLNDNNLNEDVIETFEDIIEKVIVKDNEVEILYSFI